MILNKKFMIAVVLISAVGVVFWFLKNKNSKTKEKKTAPETTAESYQDTVPNDNYGLDDPPSPPPEAEITHGKNDDELIHTPGTNDLNPDNDNSHLRDKNGKIIPDEPHPVAA